AAVGLELVDRGLGTVALEGEKGFPDRGLGEADAAQVVVDVAALVDEAAEEFEERFEVDELGRLVAVNLKEIVEDRLFHVLDAGRVVPELLEPLAEVGAVAVAVHDEVELD